MAASVCRWGSRPRPELDRPPRVDWGRARWCKMPGMKMHKRQGLRPGVFALCLLACAAGPALAQAQARTAAEDGLRPVTVASGLVDAWALAFLPDGRMLVTEKAGRLRIVGADGQLSAPLAGLPKIDVQGQCGLLDLVPDPQFSVNQRLFFSFAEPGDGGNSTAVASVRLVDGALRDLRILFRQRPRMDSGHHCGSRIVVARDGHLLIGLGDRFSGKDMAQDPANHIGKVVRVQADGGVPADNPWAGRPGAAPELWSLGHRNIQGAALHPQTGELWASEHGPQGGDEINRVLPGANYGWPLLTYGRNYVIGTRIGELSILFRWFYMINICNTFIYNFYYIFLF